MNIEQIMRMPYILFVLGMLDAPSIDYKEKKKKKKEDKVGTANDQINAVKFALG